MEKEAVDIFRSAIKKLIREKKRDAKKAGLKFKQASIADSIGVAPDNLSGFLNGHRTYSESKREDLARYFGKTYLEILGVMTSQATTTPPPTRRKTDLELHTEQIHHSVIGTFHNKELALKVNELLVDLEGLEGDDGLKAAIEWAKYRIHEAKKTKGGAGKTGTVGE